MGIYYTFQTLTAWRHFQKLGFMVGSKERAMFPEEYVWLINQMKERIPSYQGEYPIWLWPERKESILDRTCYPKRSRWVQLTIELPDEQVLLSDFDSWHYVLNDRPYLLDSEEEELESKGILSINMEKTWERIFDFELSKEQFEDCNGTFWIQGTTGKVPLSCVKKVKYFRGKQRPF